MKIRRIVALPAVRQGIAVLAWAALVWALLAAAGFGGLLGWMSEGPANFWWVPVIVAAGAWLFLRGGQRRDGGLAVIAVVVLTFWPRPHLLPADKPGLKLTMMTWNCYVGRLDPDAAASEIAAKDPDVIGFTEITPALRKALDERLLARYPHYVGKPREGYQGLAVYSKFPLSTWQVDPDARQWGSFDLAVTADRTCHVYLVHPPVPRYTGYALRARFFTNLARRVRNQVDPVIVFGDFNATWASMDLRNFCRQTSMVPATRFEPSWQAGWPVFNQVAIDHVLVTAADFGSVSSSGGVGAGAGSDHLPVLATVKLAPRPAVATADGPGK